MLNSYLNLIALLLNLMALICVLRQTYLSTKSFKLAKMSFEKYKQIRELELLPEMHFIIQVSIKLDNWVHDLINIKKELEIIAKSRNEKALKQISEKGLKTCNGLIGNNIYYNEQKWLFQICLSGAKYYYYSMAEVCNLWDNEKQKGNIHFLEKNETIERIFDKLDISIKAIEKLKEYVLNAVPDVILDAPESLSDKDFL